ncbi:MAG: pyridoxamine 5'-phosphate oxidase family protein [Lachnospiraceae bacterium]|nr:pyridoxamine 5'-phosphate oxidase family protein [Lachnospiraceae bacterium]
MVKTLLLYDGKLSSAERIADRMCYLIGSAKNVEISEAPEDLSAYEGICLVFNFYGAVTAGRTRSFLIERGKELIGKRVIMVGIGFSDSGYTKYVTDTERSAGLSSISGIFVGAENEAIRAGYEIGRIINEPNHEMEEHKLNDRLETFIKKNTVLHLATACTGYVRCTTLNYLYLDRVFYIMTEGGSKFRGILENGDVAATIAAPDAGMNGRLQSLQIMGKAMPVPVGSDEYRIAMAARGMTEERLEELPITMFLLKLVPFRYEFLDTDFAAEGYDNRQIVNTEFRRKNWEDGAAYATDEMRAAAKASEKLKEEAAAAAAEARELEASMLIRRKEEEAREAAAAAEAKALREQEQEAEMLVREVFTEPEDEQERAADNAVTAAETAVGEVTDAAETAEIETEETESADAAYDAEAADASAETEEQPEDEDLKFYQPEAERGTQTEDTETQNREEQQSREEIPPAPAPGSEEESDLLRAIRRANRFAETKIYHFERPQWKLDPELEANRSEEDKAIRAVFDREDFEVPAYDAGNAAGDTGETVQAEVSEEHAEADETAESAGNFGYAETEEPEEELLPGEEAAGREASREDAASEEAVETDDWDDDDSDWEEDDDELRERIRMNSRRYLREDRAERKAFSYEEEQPVSKRDERADTVVTDEVPAEEPEELPVEDAAENEFSAQEYSEEDTDVSDLTEEDELQQEEEARRPRRKHAGRRERAAKKERRIGFFGRIGRGIGSMLRIDTEEDEEDERLTQRLEQDAEDLLRSEKDDAAE